MYILSALTRHCDHITPPAYAPHLAHCLQKDEVPKDKMKTQTLNRKAEKPPLAGASSEGADKAETDEATADMHVTRLFVVTSDVGVVCCTACNSMFLETEYERYVVRHEACPFCQSPDIQV
ncbi:hypothetical protein KIPB_001485 [Kipferlia bialata]|uniref:Uncharacterized protein n=1 Tax=Kipferlia bialata TaxID=797122 RepID=A0A9K3GE62_9EUKA|nr:hypothetical protein KIPB_001485 [Kipferlia bialata]|eukprot:g1485.t1